ncbi:MAG: hypothetical protein WCI78_03460 [Mycobacterium sp.]
MASTASKPAHVTDADVDALAYDFLNCQFAADTYADWPLDRRLDGFLRHRGLMRLVDDGDTYELILERVMSSIGAKGCR